MATWTSYYSDNDQDGGSPQHLFDKSQQELSDMCLGHLEDAAAFALTISTSGGANVILIPKNKGEVAVLHHGFSTSTHLGGDLLLVFANGNLSESPFKVVDPLIVVHELPIRNSRTGSGSPTLQAMFGANTADNFAKLPSGRNTILKIQDT
jgi:hypothetical protein